MANTELGMDAINNLLAGARGRGDYDQVLADFLSSGSAGIEVDLTEGELAGKDPKNVVTGFNNARLRTVKETGKAKHEGGHLVQVVLRNVGSKDAPDYHVFLINKAKLSGGNNQAPAEEQAA